MTMSSKTLMLGAVAYDPKVVTIWEGFREWFAARDFDFDFVLYSNYERQVEGHFAGHYDIGWNSPLAWIEAERVAKARGRTATAVCMRDTDQDLTSLIVARADSPIRSIQDLRGKTVAVGAPDSPQATLIPLLYLAERGLQPGEDFEIQEHDRLFGKHGDHIGGERDAAKALIAGDADAACMIDSNHLLFSNEGTLPPESTVIVGQTEPYDHCCFTILDDADPALIHRFVSLLLGQDYADPQVRHLLDLEGLKRWKPGRVEGFAQLNRAVDAFGTLDTWLQSVA